jgi:hypothetical protein
MDRSWRHGFDSGCCSQWGVQFPLRVQVNPAGQFMTAQRSPQSEGDAGPGSLLPHAETPAAMATRIAITATKRLTLISLLLL